MNKLKDILILGILLIVIYLVNNDIYSYYNDNYNKFIYDPDYEYSYYELFYNTRKVILYKILFINIYYFYSFIGWPENNRFDLCFIYNIYLCMDNMFYHPLGPIFINISNINFDNIYNYENDLISKDFFDEIKRFNEEKNRLKKLFVINLLSKFVKRNAYKHNFNFSYKRFYRVSTPLFVFTQQYINYRLKSYYFSDVVFRAMRQKLSTLSKLLRNFGINIPIDIIFNIIYIYFNKKK